MGWQRDAGRNQEPSGEGKIPPCKLRLSSSNPWATGPAPFLTSSERRRDSAAEKTKNEILQQKLGRRDSCIIYKRQNHKWAIEALQNK